MQEPSADYEIGEQFVPVHDKATALDAIFRDAAAKYGLTMFACHEQILLNLWKRRKAQPLQSS